MPVVRSVQLQGATIYVEVDDAEVPEEVAKTAALSRNVPKGSELVGFDPVGKALQDSIETVTQTIRDAFGKAEPESWSVEFSIGFKGTVTLIPVLLAGDSSGGLKVKASWKRSP